MMSRGKRLVAMCVRQEKEEEPSIAADEKCKFIVSYNFYE